MLHGEHSVILSTFIKVQFVINIFILYIFEGPLKTEFTVAFKIQNMQQYWVDTCRNVSFPMDTEHAKQTRINTATEFDLLL